MSDRIIAIIAALYILSLMNERIVNWLKLSLHCPQNSTLKFIAGLFTFLESQVILETKNLQIFLKKNVRRKLRILIFLQALLYA